MTNNMQTANLRLLILFADNLLRFLSVVVNPISWETTGRLTLVSVGISIYNSDVSIYPSPCATVKASFLYSLWSRETSYFYIHVDYSI